MAGRRYTRKSGPTKTEEYYQTVAAKLIEQIEAGTAPWQKPWEPGVEANTPKNAATGKPYNGMNRVWLDMNSPDPSDPRWCTYNQAQGLGAQVRKGERGTKIQFWSFDKEVIKKDDQGKPVKDENGKPVKERVKRDKPLAITSTVFHASQMDGLPPYEAPRSPQNAFERHERCEAILTNSGAAIRHQGGDRAFYSPTTDTITLPEKDQFKSPDAYYATALHELGHWTGHESRLDRDLAHPFGSEGYAKEELRAEIASYMLGQDLEIGHDPEQHAAYVGSWVKALKEDPKEIFAAARDAQKIANYVYELDREKTTETEAEKQPEAAKEQDEKEAGEKEAVATETATEATTNSLTDDFTSQGDEANDFSFDEAEDDHLVFEPDD